MVIIFTVLWIPAHCPDYGRSFLPNSQAFAVTLALRSGSGRLLSHELPSFCGGFLHSAQAPGVLTSREASPHSTLIPFHLNSAKTFDTLRSSSGGIAFSRTAKLLRRLPALRSGSGGIDLPRGVATFDPYSVSLKQCEDFRHSPLKLWWYCFLTNC